MSRKRDEELIRTASCGPGPANASTLAPFRRLASSEVDERQQRPEAQRNLEREHYV